MKTVLLAAEGGPVGVYLVGVIVLVLRGIHLLDVQKRYKRCPSDQILVVYGKTGGEGSAKCVHGGAAFIWPIIQDYAFLDLTTHFYRSKPYKRAEQAKH